MWLYKSVVSEVKALNDMGEATVSLGTHGEIDTMGDVIQPGFFGTAPLWASLQPSHDWTVAALGKATARDAGNIVEGRLYYNLDSIGGREWWAALQFDTKVGPSLAEFSWGYRVRAGASTPGNLKGQTVRFLHASPDGSPGVELREISPVLAGASVGTGVLRIGKAADELDAARAVIGKQRQLLALYRGQLSDRSTQEGREADAALYRHAMAMVMKVDRLLSRRQRF